MPIDRDEAHRILAERVKAKIDAGECLHLESDTEYDEETRTVTCKCGHSERAFTFDEVRKMLLGKQ